jgi:hypothetical protein
MHRYNYAASVDNLWSGNSKYSLYLLWSKLVDYTDLMLGQPTPSSTRSWISNDIIWEGSARRPDDVATRPDATQCS